MCGVLCVLAPGEELMLQLCVGNWDILLKVCRSEICTHLLETSHFFVCQQVHWPSAMLNLVLVLVPSNWRVSVAVAMRVISLTVHTLPLSAVAIIVEVLE